MLFAAADQDTIIMPLMFSWQDFLDFSFLYGF